MYIYKIHYFQIYSENELGQNQIEKFSSVMPQIRAILKFLGVQVKKRHLLNVKIIDCEISYVEDKVIYISTSVLHETKFNFCLIVKHEVVHSLLEGYFGYAPALLWEGVPVYLSDNYYRKKILKFDYHQLSKELFRLNKLTELSHLILPNEYYGRRSSGDWSVDVQSASFAGFLIKRYGFSRLLKVFKISRKPTPDFPILNFSKVLRKCYGKSLIALELEWKKFLISQITSIQECAKFASQIKNDYKFKNNRCGFCGGFIENEKCKNCHASSLIPILVI